MQNKSVIQELIDQGIYLYDPSRIETFIRCPFRFYMRHEKNLIRKGLAIAYGMEFGQGIHVGIEHWYRHRVPDQAIEAFQGRFKDYEEPPSISPKTGREIAPTYTLIYGSSLLDAYTMIYSGDTREVVAIEIAVAEEISPGIYGAGRIDLVLKNKGRLVFLDHKTSKYPNDFQIDPNLQFMMYKFLCERLYGQHVTGELDMLGISKTKQPNEMLRREPFDYGKFKMENWRQSVIHHIKNITKCRERDYWPQTWPCKGPLNYHKECQYLPICTANSQDEIDRMLVSMYEVQQWDPFMVA